MRLFLFLGLAMGVIVLSSCDKKKGGGEDGADSGGSGSGRYLYVAAGACQPGTGVTTFVAASSSNLVYRIDMGSGQRDMILADYWGTGATPGTDTPVGVTDWDSTRVAVLVASGSSGRVELVPKSPWSTRQNLVLTQGNGVVIATAPRHIYKNSDGSFFITRTSAIEKIKADGARVNVTMPHVGNCGASTPIYSSMALSASSKVLATAAAAVAKVFSAPSAGTATSTAACPVTQPAPASSTNTAVVFDRVNNKVLVAYAGATTADKVNSISAYDIDETTGTLSNEQVIYNSNAYPADYPYLLHSISTMALDPLTSTLYVATANTVAANIATGGNYVIEKFSYNASRIGSDNLHVLSRVSNGGLPFYSYGSDTKCISQMAVGVY